MCVRTFQGVPWHQLPKEAGDVQASLLFLVAKNRGFAKKAGDPAFAMLFIGGIIHLLGLNALYARWSGRESRLPHSARVRSSWDRVFLSA